MTTVTAGGTVTIVIAITGIIATAASCAMAVGIVAIVMAACIAIAANGSTGRPGPWRQAGLPISVA
jgi:hypothetical protein